MLALRGPQFLLNQMLTMHSYTCTAACPIGLMVCKLSASWEGLSVISGCPLSSCIRALDATEMLLIYVVMLHNVPVPARL